MEQQQQQEQMEHQRNSYGDTFGQARQAMEAIRVMPRGGRQPEKWLPPETISVKGLKEFKNVVLGASQTTNRRVDAVLLAISILADGVRAEQQARYKYVYLKNLRAELDTTKMKS